MEKGEAYVDIVTEDNPNGKVRRKIKKLPSPELNFSRIFFLSEIITL